MPGQQKGLLVLMPTQSVFNNRSTKRCTNMSCWSHLRRRDGSSPGGMGKILGLITRVEINFPSPVQ
jgi:hypothetical protein